MRCERRLQHELAAGYVSVVEIPDIDHQMYRVWRRGDVIAALRTFTRPKSRSSSSLRNSSLQPCHS
jgi:hypothetical protein